MSDSLPEKLRGLRVRAGLSMAEMAKALGFSHASGYQRYEDDAKFKRQYLPVEFAERAARALEGRGVPPITTEEILALTGVSALPLPQSRTVEAPAWAQSPANLPRDIPVRGTAMGGAGEMFDLNGEAIDWVRRPPSLAGNKDVFGFYHVGTSMEPWRREGDLSLVSQKRPPRIGDHVLIELVPQRPGDTHGPALVKRLVARTGPKIRLAQYNPAKELEIDAAQVRHVFRIFEWQELVGL